MHYVSVFLNIAKFADFCSKNVDASRTQEAWFMYFLDLFQVRYKCAKFHIVGYVWQLSGRGAFLALPIFERPQKGSSWIRLKQSLKRIFNISAVLKVAVLIGIFFPDSTKHKIVCKKITTFFKQRLSIILWSFSS